MWRRRHRSGGRRRGPAVLDDVHHHVGQLVGRRRRPGRVRAAASVRRRPCRSRTPRGQSTHPRRRPANTPPHRSSHSARRVGPIAAQLDSREASTGPLRRMLNTTNVVVCQISTRNCRRDSERMLKGFKEFIGQRQHRRPVRRGGHRRRHSRTGHGSSPTASVQPLISRIGAAPDSDYGILRIQHRAATVAIDLNASDLGGDQLRPIVARGCLLPRRGSVQQARKKRRAAKVEQAGRPNSHIC